MLYGDNFYKQENVSIIQENKIYYYENTNLNIQCTKQAF